MARPKRNDIASKELHKAVLRLMRQRHIKASAKDIELWAFANHGIKISDVTIQKVLNGEADPTAVALELLYVVRAFLDAGPGELGHHAQERLDVIDRLAQPPAPREGTGHPFPAPGGTGDQGGAAFRCNERHLRLA